MLVYYFSFQKPAESFSILLKHARSLLSAHNKGFYISEPFQSMHELTQKIISLFRVSGGELSTSEIVERVSPEYERVLSRANAGSKVAKREIAKLHRRVLHHLNKLVQIGLLSVARYREKGEKVFVLNLREGEEVIEVSPLYKKRTVVSRPRMPAVPIEGYEQEGLVIKYEPSTWIDRLNSVVLFANKFKSIDELYSSLLENIFPAINDAFFIANSQELLARQGAQSVEEFLTRLSSECQDYGKFANLEFDLSTHEFRKTLEVLEKVLKESKLEKINFIFALSGRELKDTHESLARVLGAFSKARKDFYVRNKSLCSSPQFVG
ncbi:hypothetical protein D6817_04635, partial [Candidatus Pacearchaeota archaeon]